jgi:rod shape-determining protein MreC
VRNIFLLIRRFHVLLIFLLLQVFSISILVRYSNSHNARYMGIAYEVTGRINKSYNSLTSYFALADNNRQLAAENTRLGNLLAENFTKIDTSILEKSFEIRFDTNAVTRKYFWRPARVINNSVGAQNNFITLERGRKQGVTEDMAVVSAAGIVGVVTDVSDNMSLVMSLLHRKSNTSVALKNTGITGILEWNGVNPERLQLTGIPKSAKLAKGDTVVTSNLSLNYPALLMVGTIAGFKLDVGGNNYKIDLKPATNFFTIDYVSVIENLYLKEQKELESKIKK